MSLCDNCEKISDCKYSKILEELNKNINMGIAGSKAPFTCDINCLYYDMESAICGKDYIIIDNKFINHKKRPLLYYLIRKKIMESSYSLEDESSLCIACIYKLRKDNYLVVSYMRPLAIFKDLDTLRDHLYMNVYVFSRISLFTVRQVSSCRISILYPKYISGKLSNDNIQLLYYLLLKNDRDCAKDICDYARGYIYANYSHISNALDLFSGTTKVPNYEELYNMKG